MVVGSSLAINRNISHALVQIQVNDILLGVIFRSIGYPASRDLSYRGDMRDLCSQGIDRLVVPGTCSAIRKSRAVINVLQSKLDKKAQKLA